MHWTGILNLFAVALASLVVGYLWLGAGWHWYFAILLWPVIYLGLPILIGLAQGVVIRREQNDVLERLKRGEPLD